MCAIWITAKLKLLGGHKTFWFFSRLFDKA